MGISGEHAFLSVKEIVAQEGVNLITCGPVGTEAIEDAAVMNIGIGEGR